MVGEGEFYENIFFVKDGRLSLEAIIDLDNIEISIEKYLKYRFEEIEQINDLSNKENSFQKSKLHDQSFAFNKNIKPNKLLGIINKQFENLEDNSYIHESNIDKEIGKCDFHIELHDLYKGNIKYIHILDLLKNEFFGEILMFLNIPNPLSLIVKSKRVELYVLRKKDAFNIKTEYQNIWQRIHIKSIHNIKSLKSLTLDIIHRYCEMSGIIVKNKEIIKTKDGKLYLSNNPKLINNNYQNNQITSKTMATSKLDEIKSKVPHLKSSFKKNLFYENNKKQKNEKDKYDDKKLSKLTHKIKFNLNNENEDKKKEKEMRKSVNSDKKRKSITESSYTSSSSLSFSLSEKIINKKINKSPEQNKSNIQKNKNSNGISMGKYSMNKATRIRGYMSPFGSKSAKCFEEKKEISNETQNIKNSNKHFVITGISTINEFNASYTNYLNNLTKESAIDFQIESCYKNINDIAKGQYTNDKKLQDLIQQIIKSYIENEINKEKINLEKLLHHKYFANKFINSKLNSVSIKLSDKNNIHKNYSISSEKNKNSMYNNIEDKYSQSYLDKKDLANNKNKIVFNKSREIMLTLSKDKYILESLDIKSINSFNQLNSINLSKKQNNLSEFNNFNISNELNKDNAKYKHIHKFKNLEGIAGNYVINNNFKKDKLRGNIYSNNIINNKNENNIQGINLNYVNNICYIY